MRIWAFHTLEISLRNPSPEKSPRGTPLMWQNGQLPLDASGVSQAVHCMLFVQLSIIINSVLIDSRFAVLDVEPNI